jgi:uncharacterized protein (DUF1800 family)
MTTNLRLEAVAGSITAIADDPRGALLADLERPGAGRVAAANLPNSGQAARAFFEFRAERLAKEKLVQRAKKEAEAKGIVVGAADDTTMKPNGDAQAPKPEPAQTQQNQPGSACSRRGQSPIEAAVATEIGFVERLVWFWSNHFCVSADKILSMAGAYEREAIRPHVLGRFVDMLTAVESHPAMLFYLDNLESMGPNSVAGINRDKSLNENLAREILELHTLGVRTGYSQDDVTRFANVLTGWTWIALAQSRRGVRFRQALSRARRTDCDGQGRTYARCAMQSPDAARGSASTDCSNFAVCRMVGEETDETQTRSSRTRYCLGLSSGRRHV